MKITTVGAFDLKSFREILKSALELWKSHSEILESNEEPKKVYRQRKRKIKAEQMLRDTVGKAELHLLFNGFGGCCVSYLWKGDSTRQADLTELGFFCDCPDENRDFQFCKHKLSLLEGLLQNSRGIIEGSMNTKKSP